MLPGSSHSIHSHLESQVAESNRPVYPEVAHNSLNAAQNHRPLHSEVAHNSVKLARSNGPRYPEVAHNSMKVAQNHRHHYTQESSQELERNWVAAKELKLSYHNPETISFTIYQQYGNLYEVPQQQPRQVAPKFWELGLKPP